MGGNPHRNSAVTWEEAGHFSTGNLKGIIKKKQSIKLMEYHYHVFKESVPAPHKNEIGICSLFFFL